MIRQAEPQHYRRRARPEQVRSAAPSLSPRVVERSRTTVARVLVVEDETDLQEVLAYNLRKAGHYPIVVASGRDALTAAKDQTPDVVLLDLMLPDLSGLEVCRRLRSETTTRDVPIVIVTAKGDEVDRVVGFELGADDYVVKPYSVRELLLRIEAVLRRSPPAAAGSSHGPLVFGKLRIDREAHRVWVDDIEIVLTALELRLVATLLERRGRVQSRAALLDAVWAMSGEVTTRTVDTHIKRLREKLGSAGPYIETVRGVGYRFTPAPDHASAVGSGHSGHDEP
jgi:two-component system phosphate regulon response regulator PhoB